MANYNVKIEEFEFADGTKWNTSQIEASVQIFGTEGADSITGSFSNDVISSGDGNDTNKFPILMTRSILGSGDDKVKHCKTVMTQYMPELEMTRYPAGIITTNFTEKKATTSCTEKMAMTSLTAGKGMIIYQAVRTMTHTCTGRVTGTTRYPTGTGRPG